MTYKIKFKHNRLIFYINYLKKEKSACTLICKCRLIFSFKKTLYAGNSKQPKTA